MLLDIVVIRAEVKIRSLVEIKFTGTSKRKWHTRRHKTTRFEKVMPRATKWWTTSGIWLLFLTAQDSGWTMSAVILCGKAWEYTPIQCQYLITLISNRWPLILLFFMYMDTLYTCMFVSCVSYAAGDSKRLSDPPETRIRDGFELPYRNQEPSLDPLKEQLVLVLTHFSSSSFLFQ